MFLLRLIALLLLFAGPAAAQTQPPSAFAPLAATGFDDVRRGVEALAASGEPRAAPVLEAMQAGRLLVQQPGGALFIRAPDGAVLEGPAVEGLEGR